MLYVTVLNAPFPRLNLGFYHLLAGIVGVVCIMYGQALVAIRSPDSLTIIRIRGLFILRSYGAFLYAVVMERITGAAIRSGIYSMLSDKCLK